MGWAVARTKSLRELYAAENLSKQQYDFYLPRILVRHPRLRMVRAEPLFPSYIFINITDRWLSILNTYGISKLLMDGGNPATIADIEIVKMKNREDENGFIRTVAPPPQFRIGSQVRIKDGLHAGAKGIYDGVAAKDRVRVLMDYLGRKTKVLIAEDLLEIVEG